MKQLAIIADDLTSAMDCAIQVARSGIDAFVILNGHWNNSNQRRASVISIDTDTRNMSAAESYSRIRKVTTSIQAYGYRDIYKSVDSTLRGNIGAEIDAVMDTHSFDLCVVAPAFPLYGRTTVNGMHFLDGVPIAQTEFANDPRSPVKEGNLVRLCSSQSKRRVGLVRIGTLRRGMGAVSKRITYLKSQEVELVVFDAQVEEDLDRIVQTISKTRWRVLWVGSTGLARYICRTMSVKTGKHPLTKLSPAKRQTMLVCGSTSKVTNRQLDNLKTQEGIVMVEMRPLEIVSGERRGSRETERCKSLLVSALREGKDVALHVPESRLHVARTKIRGRDMGLSEAQVPNIIAEALAKISQLVVDAFDLRGLILTGGDTAKTVCNRLGGIGI